MPWTAKVGRIARWLRAHPEAVAASCVGLIVVAATLALLHVGGHRARSGGVAALAVPTIAATEASPAPSVSPPASPSVSPDLAPKVPTPASTSTDGHTTPLGGVLPSVAKPSPVECVGPLPPGHRAEAKCDVGKHTGLPPGCRWDGTCAWWDSWGAVPGGPSDVPIKVTPEGDLDVSWVVPSQQLEGNEYSGPVKAFYLRVHNDDTDTVPIWARELPFSGRSTVVSGLGPGTYTVCIMELNDSGIGGLCPGAVSITASPSPTPTPTASSTS